MSVSPTNLLRRCVAIGLVGASIGIIGAGSAGATGATTVTGEPNCAENQFCFWSEPNYPGIPQILNLAGAKTNICLPLPNKAEARSFVNRMHRDITLYQGAHCSTEADFRTYPGDGTYVPEAPYIVRAVEIWDS